MDLLDELRLEREARPARAASTSSMPSRSRSRSRAFAVTFASCVIVAGSMSACGPSKPPATATDAKCPDLGKPEEASAFDFAREYQLSRDAADKLKAATLAAIEIAQLDSRLDADLGIACSQLAIDLGNKGDYRSGGEACAAAVKALRAARQKLGAKATPVLVATTPLCTADASMMTKCASICDSSVAADKVKAECAPRGGRCDASCEGTCETKSAMKCDGTCAGTCEGPIKGSCSGRCKGTCDGKSSSGVCAGTCVGTCDRGVMSGECKGSCSGSCKTASPLACNGLCAGTCSAEMGDGKCAGEFKAPDVSTDCRARCDLAVMNQTECATPTVGLGFAGAMRHDEQKAADVLKAAVEKSFPALLKSLLEVGAENGEKRLLNAQAIIEGARTGIPELARSGGQTTAAASEADLRRCFDEPFKKAVATATSVKTEIDQAIGVRDEVAK